MKYKKFTILFFVFFSFLMINNAVLACSSDSDCSSNQTCKSGTCTTVSSDTTKTGGTVTLTDPLGIGNTASGPQQLIGKIIKGVLGLVGSLALAMFVYGGFTWMLAAGNPTNVEKGKQILIWATIGLIVIFSSYALVQFVFVDVLGV